MGIPQSKHYVRTYALILDLPPAACCAKRTDHHGHHRSPVSDADPKLAPPHEPPGTPAPSHQHHHHPDDHAVHNHGQHAGHSTAMFKDRFWLTLALSVPVVYFSPMFGHLLGYMPPDFPGPAWIPPV